MKQTLLFLRQWLKYPASIGAVLPSSNRLGHHIAQSLPTLETTDVVVELGGGTGSLTRAILASGVNQAQLVVIEYNKTFAKCLQERFPAIRVIQADAGDLQAVLAEHGVGNIRGIVSGLPLLSLPMVMRRRIIQQLVHYIHADVSVLQFSYSPRPPIPLAQMQIYGIQAARMATVWKNLPPASVWRFMPN